MEEVFCDGFLGVGFLWEGFFLGWDLEGFRLEGVVDFFDFLGEVGGVVGREAVSEGREGGVVTFDSAEGRVSGGGGGRSSRVVLGGGREGERKRSVREGFRVLERDLWSRWVSERLMVFQSNYVTGLIQSYLLCYSIIYNIIIRRTENR